MFRRPSLIPLIKRRFAFANLMEEHYSEFLAGRQATLSKRHAYVHPADHPERRVIFYQAQTYGTLLDMVGPEQVSQHYESFWISRRYALTGILVATSCLFLQKITDLNWVLRSWIAGTALYFCLGAFFWEVPKYMFQPMLNNFYNLTHYNELKMMQLAVPERVQGIVDKNMKESLGQFDFLILHRKFNAVKQESIKAFLVNQELELKQGVRERAADLLKMAEDLELSNQKQLVGKVIVSLQQDIEQLLRTPPQDIVDSAFESALVGIKEGRMTYQNDKALDLILHRIRAEAAKFKSLSAEQ